MNMQQTIPTNEAPAQPVRSPYASPLARAALDNGVSFEDVQAYCESIRVSAEEWAAPWYEACNLPANDCTSPALAEHVTAMVTDTVLEGALLRSVVSSGSVEHARLWWRGVL